MHRLQGIRNAQHDYCAPQFYMITMTTLNRIPWFATCAQNCATLTDAGRIVRTLWDEVPLAYPAVETSTLIIMPDHLHGIVYVKRQIEQPVGVPLRAFKSRVTSTLRMYYQKPDLTVWTPGYHDLAVWRVGALKAYRAYILDNPRRYCLKKAHPDLFTRVVALTHARLPATETWTGVGNLFLLDRLEMLRVQLSRALNAVDVARVKVVFKRALDSGVVLVSPFISSAEKAIAEWTLRETAGSLIVLVPEAMGPCYKPHGRYFDACAQGRLLQLSCLPYTGRNTPLTRALCLRLNARCAEIAADGA